MTTKLFAVLLLSLALAGCESASTDGNQAQPSPQISATPAPSPSPSASVTAQVQWKAGDKVKVTVKGAAVDATIVSVDEKAAMVVVKIAGETKERSVNLADIVKQ